MFKFAKLITLATASSVSSEMSKMTAVARTKYEQEVKAMSKNWIASGSYISHSNFDMPLPHVTYKEIMDDPSRYQTQCLFTGGTWTAKKEEVEATCVFSSAKLAALKKSSPEKDTEVEATLDGKLTYEKLFDGLASFTGIVGNGGRKEIHYYSSLLAPNCKTDYHYDKFHLGKPTGKLGDKPFSWSYSWTTVSAETEGDYCFMRTYLPESFGGGLFISHKNDADTKFALKIKSGIVDRYFDNLTIKSNASGKTGKISLLDTNHIDIFMMQNSIYVASQDSTNNFQVTFTRATYEQIGFVTIAKGGIVIGVIVGVILFCLLVVLSVCLYKKKCQKVSEQETEDMEVAQLYPEDSYQKM